MLICVIAPSSLASEVSKCSNLTIPGLTEMKADGNEDIQTSFDLDAPDVMSRTIDLCEQLMASDDKTAAKALLLSLEKLTPKSENEWERLHSLCLRLGERTRAQVYTERFLQYKGIALWLISRTHGILSPLLEIGHTSKHQFRCLKQSALGQKVLAGGRQKSNFPFTNTVTRANPRGK